MRLYPRLYIPLLVLMIALVAVPVSGQSATSGPPYQQFLPIVFGPPQLTPFGFDLRSFSHDPVIPFALDLRPKWVRAGDVLWSAIEPVRGGGYHWEALAEVEANVRRLRAQSGGRIEPALVVQQSPGWAQSIPGRLCSPPKPEYIGDYARFLAALVERYSDGPAAVRYWEIWNEPDFRPDQVKDIDGTGCWGNASEPYQGGTYYGEVLKQVYPAIKSANPKAFVLAGALAYGYRDPDQPGFLRGMLASGAGNSFDALSFHTYGSWDYGDLLVGRVLVLRDILGTYGLPDKPLFATEIGVTCPHPSDITQCAPDFVNRQANYAARIYAESIALDLLGAFWFTLVAPWDVASHQTQLIDEKDGNLIPRAAYYSFRHSVQLLEGADYIGPPLKMPRPDQMEKVQTLVFRKPQSVLDAAKSSTLYVLWVPKIEMPTGSFNLPVSPGSTALCVQGLHLPNVFRFYCSDTNRDGLIPLAIGSFPQYVEVIDP